MAFRSRARNSRLLVVVLVSISLMTITVDYRQGENGPLAAVGRGALGLISPLQEAVSRVTRPVGDFFSGLADLPSLREENERLLAELEAAQTQAAASVSLQARYQKVREVLKLQEELKPESVAAIVIANGISNSEWVVTIDKGSDDGVEQGMAVVTPGYALVGHVVRASTGSADVQLIIDLDSAVTARLTSSRKTGQLIGRGNADLQMSLLDPETEIDLSESPTEMVETASYKVAGFEGLYPPGILIGTVSRVLESPAELEQFVTVRPAVDFSSLEFVVVLRTQPEG